VREAARKLLTLALLGVLLQFVPRALADHNSVHKGTQPAFPIRAIFYYPWFPQTWGQGSHYTPTRGLYDSADPGVIHEHIHVMNQAGIEAGIASWWGQGHHTDSRIPALLSGASDTPFRWALYHEQEGYSNPSVAQLQSDLSYIRSRYGRANAYLRVNRRPVLFVYNANDSTCEVADRWRQANAGYNFYLVLKVFPGYRTCASQPDSWHQYAGAVASDAQLPHSYTISPGFWHANEATPRLSRDLNRWRQNIADQVASAARWQLLVSFNEWGEGTQLEESVELGDTYLAALAANGVPSPSPSPSPSVSPSPSPSPSPVPSPSPGEFVVMGAGDIACEPSAGFGTSSCRHNVTSDLLAGADAVLTFGDNQYEDGALSKYQQSYGPTWGRFFDRTFPSAGNHEYLTSGAAGYFDYFGARAGPRPQGYYSFRLGNWLLIALNSNCSAVGGCGVGSPQYNWLQSLLTADTAPCTIAYQHHPRWSAGQYGDHSQYDGFYRLLFADHAELLLAGHDHNYQRWARLNPDKQPDALGIREIIAGTGGKNHYPVDPPPIAHREVANGDTFGVLRLTLRSNDYSWQFLPEPGKSFTDFGTEACH
jgi:glycosyl hydrolase family 99/calcineurin-like phosphoesterase family protein